MLLGIYEATVRFKTNAYILPLKYTNTKEFLSLLWPIFFLNKFKYFKNSVKFIQVVANFLCILRKMANTV